MEHEIVLKAAEWLGRSSDAAQIERLRELAKEQRFYVTVWGHYSAGKSRLINNILNRDILPVKTVETTAVMTYIQYGSHDECTIVYEDGTAQSCDIDMVRTIFQDTADFKDIGRLDHIEICINDELLKTGLVLVDTPGVNTVIRKHCDLAADAIQQSGRIVYVLGNAPSDTDRGFITQISSCGVRISFVRTKCDRLNKGEENIQETLEQEKKDVMSFSGEQTEYIPVSNKKDSKWFSNIHRVRELLYTISRNISDEIKEAHRDRLSVFSETYLTELRTEEEQIGEIISGHTQAVSDKIMQCERELKVLEDMSADIENRVKKNLKKARSGSERELKALIQERTETFVSALEDVEPGSDISDEVRVIYLNHFQTTIERIQRTLSSYFDDMIREETEEIRGNMQYGLTDLPVPTYAEVQQKNSIALEIYRSRLAETKQRILETIEELERNRGALSEHEAGFDEAAYNEALALLDKEMAQIPSGTALRLSEHQQLQPSAVLKTIGMGADLLLLLIPGDAIFAGVKAAADTAKIAQTMHKLGKAGEVLTKVGSTIGKSAGAIDRVRDTVYSLNEIFKKRRYSTKQEKQLAGKLVNISAEMAKDTFNMYKDKRREGTVLDALSVAYWTEKLGRNFDSPPKMEIDIEEQERRNMMRKQIIAEQQQLSEERLQKKKELGLLRDKESELRLIAEEETRKKQRIEEEMLKQEALIRDEVQKNAADKYKKEYSRYYDDAVTKAACDMSEQYFNIASRDITMYAAGQNAEIANSIREKKDKISELLELKNNGSGEIEKRLTECRELIKKLEMSKQ